MSARSLIEGTLENIEHQRQGKFFQELIEAVEQFRSKLGNRDAREVNRRTVDRHVINAGFNEIIKKYTNINVEVLSAYQIPFDAYMTTPNLDANTPINPNKDGAGFTETLFLEKKEVNGMVDLRSGWVEGEIFNTTFHMGVGVGLLGAKRSNDDYIFDSDEVAAVVLHEVGHLVTLCYYLGQTHLLNHVLRETASKITDSRSPKQRVEILDAVQSTLDLEDLDKNELSKIEDDATVLSMIATHFVEKPVSMSGAAYYDRFTMEQVADQYVTRQGAAAASARGELKFAKLSGKSVDSRLVAFSGSLVKMVALGLSPLAVTAGAIGVPIAAATVTALIFTATYTDEKNKVHEDPLDRIETTRRDLIDALKDDSLTKELRASYQDQIKQIDQVLEDINEYHGFITKIVRTISPTIRQGRRVARQYKDLESLANNELYVGANKLHLLADRR